MRDLSNLRKSSLGKAGGDYASFQMTLCSVLPSQIWETSVKETQTKVSEEMIWPLGL